MSVDREQQAWKDTGAFNDRMRERGALVYARGLAEDSIVIDATAEAGAVTTGSGPYIGGPRRLAGFWILDAPDAHTAQEWAVEASAACHEPVELRAFHA